MDKLSAIFLEAVHQASIAPLASEATIYAMKSFGETALEIPVLVAVIGGLIGHSINLLIGTLLMRLPSSPKDRELFRKLSWHFRKYGYVSLVLAPLSLGGVLVVIAGMMGVSMKKALPAITIGLCMYYGQLLVI